MTYDFHYPPQMPEEESNSEQNEESAGPKASLEQLVKDTKEEIAFREKTEREKQMEIDKCRGIYETVNNDVFRKSLGILSDLEIITKEQKDNYLQAEDDLLFMLDRRINPDYYKKPNLLEIPAAGFVSAVPTAFLVALPASAIAGISNLPDKTHAAIAFGAWGAAVMLCGLAYYAVSRIFYSISKKRTDKIKNLDRAYDALLEALEPFRNFSEENKDYNLKKAEKYEKEKIVDAINLVKTYGNMIYNCVSKA